MAAHRLTRNFRVVFPFGVIVILILFFASPSTIFVVRAQQQLFNVYDDPYFGFTLERPAGWYVEGDNPWQHSDITPWHLPLIPISELQPTAVDILRDNAKTMIISLQPGDESSDSVQISVEKTALGTTLQTYMQYSIDRIKKNNEKVTVQEISKTTINGNPATRIMFTYGRASDAETAATGIQVLSIYGNLAYVIQYEGSNEDFVLHHAEFQQILDSVRITPPQSRAQMALIPLAGTASVIIAVVVIKARKKDSYTSRLLRETKRLFPSSFGIEVLCVMSAEIGGFVGLYQFGFNPFGIAMSYSLAYASAAFTTFVSILGRTSTLMHKNSDENNKEMIVCGCGDLEHDTSLGFVSGTKQTFVNFGLGLSRMKRLPKDRNAARLVRASLIVLISAESGCVIAAATIDLMFYQYSAFLSIPAALLGGALTVALMAARKSIK